jgi:hypothetical protein
MPDPWSAEYEAKESEDQDDDDHEAAAVGTAAVDAALPFVPELSFATHFVGYIYRCQSWHSR